MLYHATPHILTDMMRRPIVPEIYVDVSAVIDRKAQLLACHASQKEWLDMTQGFDSYLKTHAGPRREGRADVRSLPVSPRAGGGTRTWGSHARTATRLPTSSRSGALPFP